MQLEEFPLEDQIKGTVSSMSSDNVVTLVYKPSGSFEGLDIYASYNEVFLKNMISEYFRITVTLIF